MIHEIILTTLSADGLPNIAPMGVEYQGEHLLLKPFKPSASLDNLLATGCGVVNSVTDVRVFAGCVTGRRDWPVLPASEITGVRLACALDHTELRLDLHQDDAQRPTLSMRPVVTRHHQPFRGLNRAQAAVIEGAVLVSRLHMLPDEKVDSELRYLQIAIDKTAGPEEHEAWGWLLAAVAAHRQARS